MSFLSRMTTETGAPQPRWLYLVRKVCDTAAITLALTAFTPTPALAASLTASLVYVAVGQLAWWLPRPKRWAGPGSITGDSIYHLTPSLAVVACVLPGGPLIRLGALAADVLLWWVLENAEYGPMRSG